MPWTIDPSRKHYAPSFIQLMKPSKNALASAPELESRGNRPLQMTFEQQFRALIYFHLEEHTSGRHLIQALKEDDFAREHIAPPDGIEKSSFFEAINSRGLEQLKHVYEQLQPKASKLLPSEHEELGDLVAIDGSLIEATLSMTWADYREGAKKAKVHVGFDVNHSIPAKLFLTNGKADERPFVSVILEPGQTGIMDRYYQCHKNFDAWQTEGRHFMCRIRSNTRKTGIRQNPVLPGSIIFYDGVVLLGA